MTARRRRKGCVTFVVAFLAAAVVILVGVAVAGWTIFYKPTVEVEAGKPVQVEVPSGAGTRRIAVILAERGVVRNPNMFRYESRTSGSDGKLRAGVYDLRTGMRYAEVLAKLRKGPPVPYVTVTIPEGYTAKEIAQRLEKKAGIPATEFEALAATYGKTAGKDYLAEAGGSLEGYLFPKTYRIKKGASAQEVIDMMLAQFERELAKVDMTRVEKRGLTTHQLVIIAAMVEREIRVDKERPVCASVIYNRLDRGMKLEIDATIEYILPGNRPRLLNKHLKIDTPYNTYMYPGLPAGPISNPGLSSLQAAADPADTDYIYYVLTSKDGSHTFTKTWQEHLRAKERSREVTK